VARESDTEERTAAALDGRLQQPADDSSVSGWGRDLRRERAHLWLVTIPPFAKAWTFCQNLTVIAIMAVPCLARFRNHGPCSGPISTSEARSAHVEDTQTEAAWCLSSFRLRHTPDIGCPCGKLRASRTRCSMVRRELTGKVGWWEHPMPKKNPAPESREERLKRLPPERREALEMAQRAWERYPVRKRKTLDEINRIVREIRGGS
jgi:hypothetical protein